MLKTFLGEEDFNKGISSYLKKYSYSNAVTNDLWQALSEVQKKEIFIFILVFYWLIEPFLYVIREIFLYFIVSSKKHWIIF